MAKKVVHILYGGLGGHGEVVFTLVQKLSEQLSLSLIFYGVEEPMEQYIETCNKRGIEYYIINKKQGEYFKPLKEIYTFIRKIDPAYVITHSSNAIIPSIYFSLFNKCKSIFIEHHSNSLKGTKEWLVSYLAMLLSYKVVFLTYSYLDEVKNKLKWAFSSSKVVVINNGLDLNLYSKNKKSFTGDPIIFGMAGRFVSGKKFEFLIKAFANSTIDNAILELAGAGPNLNDLKELVSTLNLGNRVVFRGMLNKNELLEFYSQLDVYVHASDGETFSMAISQAQACGLPILASDVNGINNFIENNVNGLLFNSYDELSTALKLISNDKILRLKLSKASLNYAQRHLSDEKMITEYNKLVGL